MTSEFDMSLAGLATLFALGLRHGLDPDHIAAIDSMTLRAHDHGQAHARWTGGLFSLGHGLVVIAIAVFTAALSSQIEPPKTVMLVAEWIPLVFLVWVGVVNLQALLKPADYQPVSVKARWVPARWRNRSDPFAVAVVGILFATVFDTITLAATWGFAASTQGGVLAGLVAGVVFTAGMLLTDTADSWLIVHLSNKANTQASKQRYRRALGWLVVALAFVVVAWSLFARAGIEFYEADALRTSLGAAVMLCSVLAGWWLLRSLRRQHLPES
jgi:nickel/cobalt transporter (NiCoT) family protein